MSEAFVIDVNPLAVLENPGDFPKLKVLEHFRLEKFDTDPITGEQKLVEIIEGGQDLPTTITKVK